MHRPTQRTVSILNLISSHNGELSLIDISRLLAIPPGTIFPILQTLVQMGFLSIDKERKVYSVGMRMFLDGMVFVKSNNSYDAIRTILEKLTKDTGETTHFSKLDGGDVLYILKIDSPQPIRMYSALGKTLPAYGTGLGKALLSECDEEELRSIYPNGLKALTSNTITDFTVLKSQLEDVRRTGFAYECEESNEGVRCIARPIMKNGHVCSAISVGIPTFRYSEENKQKIEKLLIIAAEEIEKIVPYLDYI